MDRPLITIIFLILLNSCIDEHSSAKMISSSTKLVDTLVKSDTSSLSDSTLIPFSDSSYKLTLHVFDTISNNEDKNNSTVTFYHVEGNKVRKIFQDSFYCMFQIIEEQDFNNDKIKDVLIFHYTGARANPTYHLYLVDTINHKLTYVKGFEDLPNPALDSVNNIISSFALYGGKEGIFFYRIDFDHKLMNLGHSFEGDFGGDSGEYEKAIKEILKERRK